MEYVILSEESEGSLQREVNDAIKDGWVPQGGVSATCVRVPIAHGEEENRYWHFQAMVKPE